MKKLRIITMLLLACSILDCFLLCFVRTAEASEMSDKLVEQVEESLGVTVFYQQETKRLIKCFDVNKSGWYAIGYRNNTIHVYDACGTFQYGYHFNTEGTYGIVLKENSIIIYLARSHIAAELDKTGRCFYAEKKITDGIIDRTSKQVGNMKYTVERDVGLFNGDYSRLVATDEKGERVILYDATVRGYYAGIFHYIILSIFPIGLIVSIVRKIKEEEKRE